MGLIDLLDRNMRVDCSTITDSGSLLSVPISESDVWFETGIAGVLYTTIDPALEKILKLV